jgi:hypothetical protein
MTKLNITAGLHRHLSDAIAEMCRTSCRAANPPNRKRHTPYAVPELAAAMVRAIDTDDADEAKRLMLIYRTGAHSLV